MRGYIEIKEDSYEDMIEHLHRIKLIACKLIKKLSESSDLYEDDKDDDDEVEEVRSRSDKKSKGRYMY